MGCKNCSMPPAIASLEPFEATENIIFEVCRILDCDRSNFFTLDKITQDLDNRHLALYEIKIIQQNNKNNIARRNTLQYY